MFFNAENDQLLRHDIRDFPVFQLEGLVDFDNRRPRSIGHPHTIYAHDYDYKKTVKENEIRTMFPDREDMKARIENEHGNRSKVVMVNSLFSYVKHIVFPRIPIILRLFFFCWFALL